MSPDELKELRKALSCTAKELAVALGLEQKTVMAWEQGEMFPTKQFVDRMNALRAAGPSAIPRKSRKSEAANPVKALADPQLWELFRKLAAHKKLRDEVAKLAANYSDPSEED